MFTPGICYASVPSAYGRMLLGGRMSRTVLLLIGLVFVALAAAWFFTPLSTAVLSYLQPAPAAGTRSIGGSAPGSMELLNTALNALNAIFAAIGIFLTARGLRASK